MDPNHNPKKEIHRFHEEIDQAVAPLLQELGNKLQCGKGCHACCVDNITVFEAEADRIRQQAAEILTRTPHPVGKCAFLDQEGACRIYAYRPYCCRTQGLPLRWLDDDSENEYRDICPLNDEHLDLETLPESHCWTLGPVESQLQQLQWQAYENHHRVRLRDLFHPSESTQP